MNANHPLLPRALLLAGLLSLTACWDSSEDPSDEPSDDPTEDPSTPPVAEPPGTGVPITDRREGKVSPYGTDGSGNCNYPPNAQDMDVVALSPTNYNAGASCGACVEVEGPNGTVRARVVDICPACAPEKMVLSQQAYAKVAPPESPEVTMRWRLVSCAVEGPIKYHIKEGSSQYWAAIQLRNHRLPVHKMEWLKEGAWVEVKRESYNYFVQPGMGPGPVRLRVTASSGQMLEDTLPGLWEGLFDGAAQFDPQ